MQIILTQDEIEAAVREVILKQITVRDDQGISIEFRNDEDDTFTAAVTFHRIGQPIVKETTPVSRVKTGRPRKDPTVTPVAESDVAELTQEVDIPVKGIDQEETVTKIFPNVGSSAPATTATPTGLAKSLFANLAKPTNEPEN